MKATIVREDASLRAATWEGVFFEIWRGIASPDHFRDLAALQTAYAKAQPDGMIAHVVVVSITNFKGFDAEARRAMESRSRVVDPKLRAGVVVVPADGFAASVIRGIITGATLINRPKMPMKISGSTDEALKWLAPLLPNNGRKISATELTGVCAPLVK